MRRTVGPTHEPKMTRALRGRRGRRRVLLRVDAALGLLEPPAGTAGAHGEDLAEDRQRGLLLRLGADVEPARPGDALERLLGDTGLEQPRAALLLVAARAERADVE